MPVLPPIADEQSARLLRVLKAIAYAGLFASSGFLIVLSRVPFRDEQVLLVNIHRLILCLVFVYCLISLNMMWRGVHLRLSGALQIFSLWISLAIVPDLLGIPLHVISANHVALAICIGPLAGWVGGMLLSVASLLYILVQESGAVLAGGLTPLLQITPLQRHVIVVALYVMMLCITVLVIFISQRRTEISRLTAEALEVASRSEKKLDMLIESMADVMLVLDVHGRIARSNRATFALLGYTEAELYGRPLDFLLPDGDPIPRDQRVRQVNRQLLTRDGRRIPVSLSASPIADGSDPSAGTILVLQDMTELEAVRSQLQKSYVRFNQATLFSRIGVFEYDFETRRFADDESMHQTVAASGMATFSTFEEFLQHTVPEDHALIYEALENYRQGNTSRIEVEFRVYTTRGIRWIMVRGAYQADSSQNLIGTFMDVTRRKRAELELARRDELLRVITAASEAFLRSSDWQAQIPTLLRDVGLAAHVSRVYILRNHTDASGQAQWSQDYEWAAEGVPSQAGNPALQNVPWTRHGFGLYVENMRQREAIHSIVSEMPDTAMRSFLQAQQVLSLAVMPIFVQDEWWGIIGFDDCATERRWNAPELDALQLAADSLGAAIHRQRVERDLQENGNFLMSIMDNLGQGVLVMDGEGTLLFANAAVARMFGIPADRLLGVRPDNFIDPEFLPTILQNRVLRQQGKTTSYPSRILNVDGSKTDVFITGVPRYVDGKPDGSYSLVTDISERRRIEVAQMQLSTERQQMRIMSDFVRDASHDFRTPLSIIQTSLYLLRRKAESPEQLERLHTIGTQASRLSRLIDGLLTMLELDKADVTLVPINMKTVAQNCADRSRDAASKAGLSLDLVIQEDSCFVNGEEGYLMKAVANLIDNAIAFTASGGRVRLALRADETSVELTVSDTGIGIAPDEQQRIFERLYKVDKARTIDSGGLGMGLSIAKRIIELHGGTIAVTSTLNQGSAFTITLNRVRQVGTRHRGLLGASPITEDVKM